MRKKLEILFVCGAGLGSSFAAQMATESVLKKYSIAAKLDHVDISTAASSRADVIVTAENFKKQFEKFEMNPEEVSIIYLKNIVSKVEIEEKLIPVLKMKQIMNEERR